MSASYDALLAGVVPPGLFSWHGDPARDLVEDAVAAGWQALPLDTRDIGSVADFYDEIVSAWGLPDWFGRNLDALFDALADLAVQPTVIVWDGLKALADVDPEQASAAVDVLRDAAGQAPALAVVVRDDLGVNELDGLR
jgi:RNAse (barnase) inhibitor barstar